MAREQHSKEIDGVVYSVNQFGATKANKILFKLKKFIGPALTELSTVDINKGVKDPGTAKALISALEAVGDNMNEEEFDAFCKNIVSECFVGAACVKDIFDLQFQGKLENMYLLMAEVIKVNYSGFLKGVVALRSKQGQAKASESPSPSTL